MIFEHMEMSLADYIYRLNLNHTKMTGTLIKIIFRQIVEGVNHMHKHMIMHRDLKSSNILINTSDNLVKVADLGLAMHFNLPFRNYDSQIGKAYFLDPSLISF
jgi:serine/threonine protein kinase